MCGIHGYFKAFQSSLGLIGAAQIRRGPDGQGNWTNRDRGIGLGHVRLSIIDPTSAGHQPMLTPDQRVVMVFNGEIYNFRELRDELEADGYRFQGHSDSEVLLHLFARDGTACFGRLNGIFAAAFWEQDIGLLTLVRDPVGVKPLYFAENANGIVFASEMKGFL